MAYASFPRLIMEMALLKAALLPPLVPIQELIDKIKALETSAVHTPSLPWETAGPTTRPLPQHTQQLNSLPDRPPLPATAVAVTAASVGGQTDWGRFVSYVNEKDRQLGSVLEHGSPLKQEAGLVEIGFPAGSYYLTAAQDADFIADVKKLADGFVGSNTVIRVRSIESGSADTPLSLAEKKKSDATRQLEELKTEVENHPLVKEAERVFGCSVTEVHKF